MGFSVRAKQRHTEVMLSLTEEMEDLYAGKLEQSDLTLDELNWLVQMHGSSIPRKFAQVMVGLLGSDELQELIQKVNN